MWAGKGKGKGNCLLLHKQKQFILFCHLATLMFHYTLHNARCTYTSALCSLKFRIIVGFRIVSLFCPAWEGKCQNNIIYYFGNNFTNMRLLNNLMLRNLLTSAFWPNAMIHIFVFVKSEACTRLLVNKHCTAFYIYSLPVLKVSAQILDNSPIRP